MSDYRWMIREYRHILKENKAEAQKLLQSRDGRTYKFVNKEYAKTRCRHCVLGRARSDPSKTCSECGGTGKSSYVPKVTPKQQDVADKVRRKIQALEEEEVLYATEPRKMLPAYIRIV